jgi:adenine/guanine phosphoribosyltransferase-like PRPP-binding protein
MEEAISTKIKQTTITYSDFPKPGVSFIDIFPIVCNPEVYKLVIDSF